MEPVRCRSRFNLLTNSIAAAKTSKVLRNEKTKGGKGKGKEDCWGPGCLVIK
jgi:hypothetical protein